MPELPEVEVAARNLRRWAAEAPIRGPSAPIPRRRASSGPATPKAVAALRRRALGQTCGGSGKNLLLTLAPARPRAARSSASGRTWG